MSTYLICSTPVFGHVRPMTAIARRLHEEGHRVVVLTGSRFAREVAAAGAEHVHLPGAADYDDRDPDDALPDRAKQRGIGRARYDIEQLFIRTIPAQHRALAGLIPSVAPDAVLADSAFVGVLPLLLGSGPRPPIVGIGVLPLSQSSRDLAPYGTGLQPSTTRLGRLRNAVLDVVTRHLVFGRTQRLADEMLAAVGSPPLDGFVLDLSARFDRFLQLSVPEFEHPRSDLRDNTRMVGPVLPEHGDAAFVPPPWWDDLADGRPVVHVTQGTIDNHDLGRLIGPTIEAVRDRDVLLVVSTGGRPVAALGPLPDHVRAAEFVPYDRLLPLVDLVVTNGGYGGVHFALAEGIPMVVAGDTEDKPEVAARIVRSGVGIDLRTGSPTAAAVGAAIDRVLATDSYPTAAAAVARSIAGHDALGAVSDELHALTAAGRSRA